MSGDYETLEINQPKITYFKKESEDKTLWLERMKKEIEDEGGGEDDMMMAHDPTISEDKND